MQLMRSSFADQTSCDVGAEGVQEVLPPNGRNSLGQPHHQAGHVHPHIPVEVEARL